MIGIREVRLQPTWRGLAEERPVLTFTEDCYFPSSIKVDEEFEMHFVCAHQGPACSFWLGFSYKGSNYAFTGVDGIPLEEGQGIRCNFEKTTMRKFLEEQELEKFDESKTIEIDFKCGFIENDTHYWTDSLPFSCYVQIPGIAIPWPGWVGGGLVVLGIIAVAAWPRR